MKNINRILARWAILLLIIVVVIYRIIIIKDYCAKWVDEDQALLWYGTALAGHLGLTEPHFLGQAYGSMLESIVAVPMYWIGVPLNYCLPIATTVLWYIPFVISGYSLRKKNLLCASIILASPLVYRWDYDILTSVSRSFICGFTFAFVGIEFLCNNENLNKPRAFFVPILMSLAYINTETTITIIMLGILFVVLYRIKTLQIYWRELVGGMVIAAILYKFCNDIYYRMNPEYMLHSGKSMISLSKDTLKQNFADLRTLLNSFSVINIDETPVVLILIVVCILAVAIMAEEWKLLFADVCALVGTMLFLALPKTRDFYDNLLFSQTRMFLFIAYVILVIIDFAGHVISMKKCCTSIYKILYYTVIVFSIVLAVGKIIYFKTVVLEKEDLYNSAVIRVSNTENIYNAADEISKYAIDNECSVVVMLTDNRVLGYATGAINYNLYTSYNAFYDRRTGTYLKLKENIIEENVLLVETDGDVISNVYVEYVNGNLIDWIREHFGIQRYPESDARYISQ